MPAFPAIDGYVNTLSKIHDSNHLY